MHSLVYSRIHSKVHIALNRSRCEVLNNRQKECSQTSMKVKGGQTEELSGVQEKKRYQGFVQEDRT